MGTDRQINIVWPLPLFGSVDEVAEWFNLSKHEVRAYMNRARDCAPHLRFGRNSKIDTMQFYAFLQTQEIR